MYIPKIDLEVSERDLRQAQRRGLLKQFAAAAQSPTTDIIGRLQSSLLDWGYKDAGRQLFAVMRQRTIDYLSGLDDDDLRDVARRCLSALEMAEWVTIDDSTPIDVQYLVDKRCATIVVKEDLVFSAEDLVFLQPVRDKIKEELNN